MNIGFFTDTYLPQINGVAISIDSFRRELERRGHSVYVFAPRVPGHKEKDSRVMRFRSLSLGPFFSGKGSMMANRLVMPFSVHNYFKLHDIKLDIIHSHTEMGMGTLAIFAAKRLNVPHVHTYHTLYPEYVHYLGKGKIISKKGAEKLSALYCNRCQTVIAPSQKIKELLWKYGVKKQIEVLETGIDLPLYSVAKKDTFRKKYGIDEKTKILLCVGRQGKEKGMDVILWAHAAANIEKCLLVFVGDGPERPNLERMAKDLGIDKKVLFTGLLPYQEVVQAYAAADLFVFASVTETQGIVLLEAAASGLPIIAVNDSVVSQYVHPGQNGVLVKDAKEMAKEIIKFFENPWEAAKMEKVSRQIAASYSIQNQTEKLLEIYRQTLVK